MRNDSYEGIIGIRVINTDDKDRADFGCKA